MTERIQRIVFAACARGKHDRCECWRAGWIDGWLRSAGEQCACECHSKKVTLTSREAAKPAKAGQ